MNYKNRLIFLFIIIAVLVFAYAGSFIFNSDTGNVRSALYVWMDSQTAGRVNRISLNSGWDEFELVKKNDQWFIIYYYNEYPARQMRVEDFLSVFTTRSAWPVRSSNDSTYERFGLGDDASRITFYGNNQILLDVLLGYDDIMGRETYFRRIGQNEVRSGNNSIRTYLSGYITSWYNLRLIPESEGGSLNSANVQRLIVNNNGETQIFSRVNRRWEISGITAEDPDVNAIDSYINFILNAEGEDFVDPFYASFMTFDHSYIRLEFGNGSIITINVSEPDEINKRYAQVSNSEYTYVIPLWVSLRLFRDAASFEMQ